MPALEALTGIRIVATPSAIDGGSWHREDVVALRFAPDEVLVLGTSVRVWEDDAIYEPESGFVGVWLDDGELGSVLDHIEWRLPSERPALAQGKVAGVPAKLWFDAEGRALLVTHAAYAADLETRLGWRG